MIRFFLKHTTVLTFVLMMIFGSISQAQPDEDAPAASITFSGITYHPAWSSEPTAEYSKYEHLPPGQELPNYHNMLLLERLANGMSVVDAVRSQVEFLNQRKDSDPVANHRLINNESTGESLLDFVLSGKTEDGETIIEWNAYRYSPWHSANGGTEGIQLYGYSARAYGDDDGRDFLIDLRETRAQIIQALVSASTP